MTCKAYCGRVITEWLASALGAARLGRLRDNEEIRLAAVTVTLIGINLHCMARLCIGHIDHSNQ